MLNNDGKMLMTCNSVDVPLQGHTAFKSSVTPRGDSGVLMIQFLENILTKMAYECSSSTYLIQIRWFCEHHKCQNIVA